MIKGSGESHRTATVTGKCSVYLSQGLAEVYRFQLDFGPFLDLENALPVTRTEMLVRAHSSSVPGIDKPKLCYKFLLTYAKTFLLGSANGQLEGPVFLFIYFFIFLVFISWVMLNW